jgi:hypothetical protein
MCYTEVKNYSCTSSLQLYSCVLAGTKFSTQLCVHTAVYTAVVLHLRSGNIALRNTRATGGFLKTAHTINRILVQIFGPKIQAQN